MKKRYLLSALVEDSAYLRDLSSKLEKQEAEIERIEDLGKKKLCYKIQKHSELSLISIFFFCEPEPINKIRETLRHDEHLVRSLLTIWNADPVREKKKDRESSFEVKREVKKEVEKEAKEVEEEKVNV